MTRQKKLNLIHLDLRESCGIKKAHTFNGDLMTEELAPAANAKPSYYVFKTDGSFEVAASKYDLRKVLKELPRADIRLIVKGRELTLKVEERWSV